MGTRSRRLYLAGLVKFFLRLPVAFVEYVCSLTLSPLSLLMTALSPPHVRELCGRSPLLSSPSPSPRRVHDKLPTHTTQKAWAKYFFA